MSRRRSSDNGDCKVYVGDLRRDVSERDLEKVFREFGPLKSVWVTRNPPGFAFIEYEDERDAADAIRELDGTMVCGSHIRVRNGNFYPSRTRGPPRGAVSRRPFDPSDRCYRCNKRGHYAYDCDKYGSTSSSRRERSYSRSRSHSRGRRRSPSHSRSASRSRSRDRRHSRSRS